jgi:hypothetical protein
VDVAVLVVLGLVLAVVMVIVVQHSIALRRSRADGPVPTELERREGRAAEREDRLDTRQAQLDERSRDLAANEVALAARQVALDRLEDDRRHVLEQAAGLTAEQARSELVAAVEHQAKRDAAVVVREIERTAQAEGEALAREIVVGAIQRLATEQTSESVVSVLHLPGDDMKGRIIGREGRNIRAFEQTTGVNLIIDDTPEAVLLSCFDPCAGKPRGSRSRRSCWTAGSTRSASRTPTRRRAARSTPGASGPARTRWSRSASPTCTPSWSRCSGGCTTARRTARTSSSTCSSRRTWPA